MLTQLLCASVLWCAAIASGQSSNPAEDDGATLNTFSVHQQQQIELGDILIQPPETEEGAQPSPGISLQAPALAAGATAIDPSFINFGYAQSNTPLLPCRWNALTHVAVPFTSFDSSGNWTNLTSTFTNRDLSLQAGGAAANAGVKVILTALNSGFSSTVTDSVMQSSTNRATLISNVVSAVTGDAYCQGVTFDFEPFSYGSTTRDGMTLFFSALRTAFNASSKPSAEISLYIDATYSSTNYNITGLEPSMDYFLYSCYDWGTGSTPHAISDTNNYVTSTRANGFLNAGIPANKMVLVESAYGRQWDGTSTLTYGATGGTKGSSLGFCDGLFDTTLNTANSGPYANTYVTGDETGWYGWNDGSNHVAVWEDPKAVEYKVRLATSFQDSGGTNNGKRLRGVGWWSLLWMSNFTTSYNPLPTGTPEGNASYTRTYPNIYQLCEEILSPPGTTRYVFDKFEGDNPRWSHSTTLNTRVSPDNTNWTQASTTKALITAPGGTGAPPNTTKAMDLHFVFSSSSAGKIFFRHEVLKDNTVTSVADTNALDAKFDDAQCE